MEQIYLETAPNLQNGFVFVTRSQVMEGTDPEDQMLLTKGCHKLVAQSLGVPELSGEVERAVSQVEQIFERARALEQEKIDVDRHQKEQEKLQEQQRKP